MTVILSSPEVAGALGLLLRATLLLGMAWTAAAALRAAGASAAVRHMAWLCGIAALLALPFLWWLAPALHLPILPAVAAEPPSVMASPAPFPAGPVSPEAPVHFGLGAMLAIAYALVAAALVLRLVVGRRMLTGLWHDSGAVRDPEWDELLSRLSLEMRLSRRVKLRIARGPAVPMTWGTLAPRLLLPAEASEWPPERRRLVLLHELAHVARYDSLSRSVASLTCAFYWFHPGAWFAARQMRLEQEQAADDRVLVAGGSVRAYALSLLHLARGMKAGPRFDQAAAMAGMYQLERRLVSITSPARRDRPGALFLSSSTLLAALATFVAAAAVPVSASLTRLGPSPAKPVGLGAPKPVEPESPQGTERRVAGDPLERVARDAVGGPRPRPEGLARRQAAPRGREQGSPAEGSGPERPPSFAYAEQLRDYGWELPRRDPGVRIGSPAEASRPDRLIVPTPLRDASSRRTGLRKLARNVPRVVHVSSSAGSPLPISQGDVMLSLSLDVGTQE